MIGVETAASNTGPGSRFRVLDIRTRLGDDFGGGC